MDSSTHARHRTGCYTICDEYGPSRKLGLLKDFEVGNHDGAYKGRMHSHTLFIGRKVLTKSEREYIVLSTSLPACVIRDIWMGSARDLHANTCIRLQDCV